MIKINNITIIFIILLITGSITNLLANWKSERENLDKRYTVDKFRFHYTTMGNNSLDNIKDINNNNIPDIIENTAIQLTLAKHIIEQSFGLINPLKNKRYKDKVKFIDIHFIDMKYSGDSGDGIIKYNYKSFNEPSSPVLSITLSNKLKTENLTPVHELFHTYQNGYTYFKTRWFTEGTSRWFEYGFKKGVGKEAKLPTTLSQLNELVNKTYDAKLFWNRITHLCNKKITNFKLDKKILKTKYIGYKTPVIEDTKLYGYRFIHKLFINLAKQDKIAFQERKLKRANWKESEQQSYKNNRYILQAIIMTIDEMNCKNKEIQNFKKLVKKFIKLDKSKIKGINFTKYLEDIGVPSKSHYPKVTDIYARNPWDMQLYKDKIYIASGNTYNIGPAKNAGPVPIITLDIKNNKFAYEGLVDDEQIQNFYILNDSIYIAGADAIQSHEFGNFYFKNNNNIWIKKRTIPNAYHVFSLNYYKNKLFAGISTAKGAEITWSANNGKNWATQQLGIYQSTYNIIVVKDKLYAIKQFLPKKRQKKFSQLQAKNYHVVSEYKNGAFIPRKDITTKKLFPNTKLNMKKYIRINFDRKIKDKTLIIGGYNPKEPFGVYLLSSLKNNNILSTKIDIDPRIKATDIIIRGDIFYILGYQKQGKRFLNSVIKVSLNSLTPKTIIQFKYPALVRSFEEINGDFYFGIGSDIKNARKWKQKEISPHTGRILKLNKKHITTNNK